MDPNAGGGGEAVQAGMAAAAQEQREQESHDLWLILNASMIVFLELMSYLHLVLIATDLWFLTSSTPLHLERVHLMMHLMAVIGGPLSTMLLYHVHNTLEREAFDVFEEMFPPDKEGMGDAKRMTFSRKGSIFSTWRMSKRQMWLFMVQLPFLLMILHDLNRALHHLGWTYALIENRHLRIIVLILMALANLKYKILPTTIFLLLITDSYGNILTFLSNGPISTCAWIRTFLGLVTLIFWKLRLKKRRRPFVPKRRNAVRLLLGHIGQNMDLLMLEHLNFLVRWMRLTGETQRRVINDQGQIRLVPQPEQQQQPVAQDDDNLPNLLLGLD